MAIINLNIKIMKNKLSNISKKSKMIAATAFVLGMVSIGGVACINTTLAAEKPNQMSSLISVIAERFNLNSSEVEAVVNEVMQSERFAREAQGKVDQAEKLSQAVTDGKITQAQADLITNKLSELKEANKNLTREERQLEQESLKEWATSNNIPMNFLQCGGQRGPGENEKAPNKTE